MHRASLKNTLHAILADYVIRAGYKPNFDKDGKRITIEANIAVDRIVNIIDAVVNDNESGRMDNV
jgi:hypothetical protein